MRILFVAMVHSVHTARWITQLAGQDWDIHVFPVEDTEQHPQLSHVTMHGFLSNKPAHPHPNVKRVGPWWPFTRGAATARRILHRSPSAYQVKRLADVIRKVKPDIVHSMEFQHAGYLTLAAREHFGGEFPPWLVTNWGSDIYLFGRLREHVGKIKAILATCDFYSCECRRDVLLAKNMGFCGECMPVIPVSGGFDLSHASQLRTPGPTSARRLIVLKGYQGWAGRALVGLRAIALCARELQGYRVLVYVAGDEVRLSSELVSEATGIPIEIVPRCSHEDILRLFGQARAYVGLSISDGISTSLLEAIVMGAFPVQSNTSAADEWVKNGETGFIVPPEDPEPIAAAIRRALSDDALVDRAAEVNWKTATERLDGTKIREQVIAMYRKIAENC